MDDEEYGIIDSMVEFYYQNKDKKNMQNGILTLDAANIKSALITVLLTSLAGVLLYIVGLGGDLFMINFHVLLSIFVLALANGLLSVIKSLFTTNKGNFVGVVTTVSPTQ